MIQRPGKNRPDAGLPAAGVMGRAAFGVLVIPFSSQAFAEPAVALFSDCDADGGWGALTGPGIPGETPLQAARRHTFRRARVPAAGSFVMLDSRATIPIPGAGGPGGLAEYAFAALVDPVDLRAAAGRRLCWVSYDVAWGLLQREAEHNALWELAQRRGWRRGCR